ncbi:hypothetical protein EVAR_6020_1 [Eumeta japonica]|uniref:Uncharacterized protein n=1 Tax=Eumeta variegata TaxID=151549 RepID=A0A4C1TAP0_EUMVA|nr:hypothetical protein EVAR_6020_1 [Eumeta japonica]
MSWEEIIQGYDTSLIVCTSYLASNSNASFSTAPALGLLSVYRFSELLDSRLDYKLVFSRSRRACQSPDRVIATCSQSPMPYQFPYMKGKCGNGGLWSYGRGSGGVRALTHWTITEEVTQGCEPPLISLDLVSQVQAYKTEMETISKDPRVRRGDGEVFENQYYALVSTLRYLLSSSKPLAPPLPPVPVRVYRMYMQV